MAGPIAAYYAQVGISVDNAELRKVDKYLDKIEQRLGKVAGTKALKVNPWIDTRAFYSHVASVFEKVSNAKSFEIKKFKIDRAQLIAKTQNGLDGKEFSVKVRGQITKQSLAQMRVQIQEALQNIPVSVNLRGARGTGGTPGSNPSPRRNSVTGRGDPSTVEFLMGRPDKSSLSAGNRRYLDSLVKGGTSGFGGGIFGQVGTAAVGGLARIGGGSIIGRGLGAAGAAIGGPLGGTLGLLAGAVAPMAYSAFTGIWSTFSSMLTAPFSLLSGAISTVTDSFYRLAQTLIPFVAGFVGLNHVNREYQGQSQAMNNIATKFGSTGEAERAWLYNMSMRDGMRMGDLMQPFTSFIASAAPSLGLKGSKDIFQAFTQFGLTRGADSESTKRALVAISQINKLVCFLW